MKSKRAAAYVRVSSFDQNTEAQETALREYVQRRGWTLNKIYRDEGICGARASRPALDELLRDCRRKTIDVVVVWKFDRFARSLTTLVSGLELCRALGIDFVSGDRSGRHLASDGRAHVPDNRCNLAVREIADRRTGQIGISKCSGKGEGPGPTASTQVIAQGDCRTEARTRPRQAAIQSAGQSVRGFGLDRSPALRGPILGTVQVAAAPKSFLNGSRRSPGAASSPGFEDHLVCSDGL
jgi:hypothetical protein